MTGTKTKPPFTPSEVEVRRSHRPALDSARDERLSLATKLSSTAGSGARVNSEIEVSLPKEIKGLLQKAANHSAQSTRGRSGLTHRAGLAHQLDQLREHGVHDGLREVRIEAGFLNDELRDRLNE